MKECYGIIKQEIMDSKSLTKNAKLIYAYLCSFADYDTGECFPSLSKILEGTGLSKNTFYKGIKELESNKIILRKQQKNKPTIYKILNYQIKNTKTEENCTIPNNYASRFTTIGHRTITYNNNMLYRESIESRDSTQSSQELYLNREGNSEMSEDIRQLISKYAVDSNHNFSLKSALEIEKIIYGAKKSATLELMKEGVVSSEDLNDQGYIFVDFEDADILKTLENVFYQFMKDQDLNNIKNKNLYMFSAMKNQFKNYLEYLYSVKNYNGLEVPILSDDEIKAIHNIF